jgi:hypothetical protein
MSMSGCEPELLSKLHRNSQHRNTRRVTIPMVRVLAHGSCTNVACSDLAAHRFASSAISLDQVFVKTRLHQ